MKKLLSGLLLLGMVGITDAQWYVPWYAQNPTLNNLTLTGTLSVTGVSTLSDTLNLYGTLMSRGRFRSSYNYTAASYDEDVSFSFISTGTATGNSGKVSGLRSEYNWYGGDNASYIAEGLEGVVRSRAVDTDMTGRGVSGRIYAGTGYTMKTGIGVEAAYRIEDTNHPAYGSSYSALRAWCYPGWTTNSSTNVVNNYGIWVVNQHATNEIAAGMRFDSTSYGGKFTKELQLQNGATIDNYTLANVSISTNTEVKGMLNVSGTQTNVSSVTIPGTHGDLEVGGKITTKWIVGTSSATFDDIVLGKSDGTIFFADGKVVTGQYIKYAGSNIAAYSTKGTTYIGKRLDINKPQIYLSDTVLYVAPTPSSWTYINVSTWTVSLLDINNNLSVAQTATANNVVVTSTITAFDVFCSSKPQVTFCYDLNGSSLTSITANMSYEVACGTGAIIQDTNHKMGWFKAVADENGNLNRITYVGKTQRSFFVQADASIDGSAATLAYIALGKNGTVLPCTAQHSELTVVAPNEVVIPTCSQMILTTNDYIELYLTTNDSDDLSVHLAHINIHAID